MINKNEQGIALISVLLVMVLLGVLLEGFILSINSEQGLIGTDREQNRAFYGAQAGLEQLTASLGNLFSTNYAPSAAQIRDLTTVPPVLSNLSFVSPDGSSGYQISTGTGSTRTIPSGPYEGLIGLLTPYTMTATARTLTGAEVRMQRTLQTVAIPVFQFGIFSETDLSFFAGPNFDFGGRVHTNGNLFLAEGNGSTLTMKERVTAVGEVIRTNLANGWDTNSNYTGTVRIVTTPGAFRNLARTEGSLVGTLGTSPNEPTWTNLSTGAYHFNIRSGRTGARRMDLPLATMGAAPIDLIKRPPSNENIANPEVYKQRFYAMASLRILISDNAGDITGLPTVDAASAPQLLTGNAPDGTPYAVAGAGSDFKSPGTTLVGGYIKIEMQNRERVWSDVTNEILGLGIAGRDLSGSSCTNQPNSIIRVQRLKDSPTTPACGGGVATQYWPNVLYDTREGILRDNISATRYEIYLGGIMHYIELDVNNLCRWFRGEIGASGTNAIDETGYVVYFSDRRTNGRDADGKETAEYGFEDNINYTTDITNGIPNGVLETGEDVNGNGGGVPETYGEFPVLPPGVLPFTSSARPWLYTVSGTSVTAAIARKNRPIFFRRALKLVNGSAINLGSVGGTPFGLAVISENPVYVQGNYNSTGGTFDGSHVAASVIADAVTLLSNNWNDVYSFNCPHSLDATCNSGKPGRVASTTWYRMAIIAGKGKPFPHPEGLYQDFGTDGGVHNFLRYLENWGGQTLNYRGSIVSLYFNRQATGIYKCCTNVYSPPSRGYNFDTDFLTPALLPPRTPMFRDVNITGFTRMNMPSQ